MVSAAKEIIRSLSHSENRDFIKKASKWAFFHKHPYYKAKETEIIGWMRAKIAEQHNTPAAAELCRVVAGKFSDKRSHFYNGRASEIDAILSKSPGYKALHFKEASASYEKAGELEKAAQMAALESKTYLFEMNNGLFATEPTQRALDLFQKSGMDFSQAHAALDAILYGKEKMAEAAHQ